MLELGNKSCSEHIRLGEFLDSQPLTQIYLYGEFMKDALPPLKNTKAMHFTKKEDLLIELKRSIPEGAVVFFKASRGMKFEELIDNLYPQEEIN